MPVNTRRIEVGGQPTRSLQIGDVMTYLIYCIDERLDIVLSQPLNNVTCPSAREGCLDEGYEFTLGDRTADQVLQGLPTGIENEGWPRGG